MKHLFLALSVLLSTSLSALGGIYSISPYFTIDIPSGWSVTNNDNGYISITSPTGAVVGNLINIPAPPEKTIYAVDYDALNLILKDSLLIQDFAYIDNFSEIGLYFMDMTDATYYFGTSTSGQYYVGNSVRSMGFKPYNNLSATYIYTVANYVLFDGESLFTARLSVNPNGDASEIQDMYSMISSVNSSYINSPSSDSDGDGITNFNEVIFYGSNPNQIDSNGDGINDDVITSLGGHPNWDLTSTLDYIGQNPSQFNLHSLEDIADLREGSKMIEIHNGQANLSMEVEQSNDLGIWTTGGTASVQINVQPGEDKKFFRFKMNNSDFDGNDITLSVGNTEYDEAAIKAALAEQYGVSVESLTLGVTNGN